MVHLSHASVASELDPDRLHEAQRQHRARDARSERIRAHRVEAERVRASLLLPHRTSLDGGRER
jgi:hypothetical protein